MTKNKKHAPRGYLLVEALVGAGVVASAMTAMMLRVGEADVRVVQEQRERAAQSLVYESYERRRAAGYDNLPSTAQTLATDAPKVGGGTYARTVKLTGVGTESFGSFGARTVQLAYKEVEVEVAFAGAERQQVRVVQKFRVYRT